MQFTKMHGIGNDFIMVNCLSDTKGTLLKQVKERSTEFCDRRFSIGADGVIAVLRGSDAPFAMRMFNPDGTEAEMCGNGIRCFAKYLCDHGHTNSMNEIAVETGAGLLHLNCQVGKDNKAISVRVDMGEPHLIPSEIPVTLSPELDTIVNQHLEVDGNTYRITCVSMGNPHAVIFVDNVKEFPVAQIGPKVEHHVVFPKRTNTEFIQVHSRNEIQFRVWERGAAETLACGTGACAAVVAAVLNDKTDRNVLVHLPGGDLQIEWSQSDNHVYMTGAAVEVYTGAID